MTGSKYFVYGGRWRELDSFTGSVAGWAKKAQFVYMKRGRLRVAKRRRVLAALQAFAALRPSAISLGARLSVLSKESFERTSEKKQQRNVQSVTQPAQCIRFAHPPAFVQPAQPDQCIKQHGCPHCTWCDKHYMPKQPLSQVTSTEAHDKPVTELVLCQSPEKQTLTINISNTTNNLRTQNDQHPLDNNKTDNIDRRTVNSNGLDSLLKENMIKHKRTCTENEDVKKLKKNIPTSGSANSRKTKHKKKEMEKNSDNESDEEFCKELTIPDSDVRALRSYVAKARKDALKRFDTDDDYKLELFYAINPLVNVERCSMTERAIRERHPMALAHFAARLGLTPSPGPAGDSTYTPHSRRSRRVRHENLQKLYKDESYSEDGDFQKSRLIKRSISRNKMVVPKKATVDSKNVRKNSEHKKKQDIKGKVGHINNNKPDISNSDPDYENKISDNNIERIRREAKRKKLMSQSSSDDSSDDNVRNKRVSLRKGVDMKKQDTESDSDSVKKNQTRRNPTLKSTTKRSKVVNGTNSDDTSDTYERSLSKSTEIRKNCPKNSRNIKRIALRRSTLNNPIIDTSSDDTSNESTDEKSAENDRKKYELRKHNVQESDSDDSIKNKENKGMYVKSIMTQPRSNVPSSTTSETDENRRGHMHKKSRTNIQQPNTNSETINGNKNKPTRENIVTQTNSNGQDSNSENFRNKHNSSRTRRSTQQAQTNRQQTNSNKEESELTKSSKSVKDNFHSSRKELTAPNNSTNLTVSKRNIIIKEKFNKRNDSSSNESDDFKSANKMSKPVNKMLTNTRKHLTNTKTHTDEHVANKSTDKEAHVIRKRAGFKQYSNLEDHAIVAWVSSGGRARKVNGNRLWKELANEYSRLTGVVRSWHSIRNRYLRHVLPALGSLGLPPAHVSRLRAAAATGELKFKRSGLAVARRNSMFKEQCVGAASRRPPAPVTPVTPTDRNTRRQTQNSAGLNNHADDSEPVRGRLSRTSARARHHEESEKADVSGSEGRQSARSPATPLAAPKSRTRKLFNPNLVF